MGTTRVLFVIATCGPLFFACNEEAGSDLVPPTPSGSPVNFGPSEAGAPNAVGTDDRPAIQAETPPPPVSGGNLLVTHDGAFAVVADSDRDRVVVVDTAQAIVVADLALKAGDEPGRLAEDTVGRVHIALRRGDAVVTLDLASLKLVDRRGVCGGPRGIAYDDAQQSLLLACADGKLVTLPSASGTVSRSVFIGPDLRDVVINGSGTWISTFKSAELRRVDASGAVVETRSIPRMFGISRSLTKRDVTFQPEVAWRAATFKNDIVLLHQVAQVDSIEIVSPPVDGSTTQPQPAPASGSAYGDGQCGAVVRPVVTTVHADGTTETSTPLGGGTLPVDLDVSPSGQVAIAFAGSGGGRAEGLGKFGDQPLTFTVLPLASQATISGDSGAGGAGDGSGNLGGVPRLDGCINGAGKVPQTPPIVAVRFNPRDENQLFLLSRNPATLFSVTGPDFVAVRPIDLGGADVTDTGHDLFHNDAGGGIACASCHPEGTEDGHVWTFSNSGPRRTQALNAGLAETAPFHWDGGLADVGQLMEEVFVKRMGGEHESVERVGALQHWLFELKALPPLRAADDEAAQRGANLFASAEVACATCHTGPALTTNLSVKVGTEAQVALQVPSLLGIGHRAPFMHTGCAATLLGRFDPACGGGEEHGHTAQLSDSQLNDLVAYLETL